MNTDLQDRLSKIISEKVTDPITPYAGNSGWSGSETSRERAIREDEDGTTSKRQNDALNALFDTGEKGLMASRTGFRCPISFT